jgi:hypothetical protein
MNEEDDSYELIESEEEVEHTNLVLRISKRIIKPIEMYIPPDFCSAFVLTATDNDPKSVREAVDLAERKLLKDAMFKEMEYLHKNKTHDLFKLPSEINPFNRKWVFKNKMNATSQVEKFKSRLVAKGYSQVEGVDFSDIFSCVEKLNSIRVLMSLATTFDLEI